MNINNLYFFDKYGYPYDFKIQNDSDTNLDYLYGEIFIQPTSISLFDSINIYILEKKNDNYYFPFLDSSTNEKMLFKWIGDDVPNFFLYDVLKDEDTNSPYINQLNSIEFSESFLDVKIPYQLNIAFSPNEEKIYERYLNFFHIENNVRILVLKIKLYGEGLGEDERFKLRLENFGIKFNKTDSLCLKDYDINEVYPDWEDVNQFRKQLILNKEEIFPYVGTYYGLKNFVDILGYKDVLDVKEYYKNVDVNSEYFGKHTLVSISDMLDDGKIDNINILDSNRNIKFNNTFNKTGFLALAYEFTKMSGRYDADGIPIIEDTTDFTPSEMYYKLHKVKDILQKQFLPVNVQIKDIIGEWTYVVAFKTYTWTDNLIITSCNINSDLNIDILPKFAHLKIYDISTLSKKEYTNGINFPIISFNENVNTIPFNQQDLKIEDVETFIDSIDDFYKSKSADSFNSISTSKNEFSEDYLKPIGCPVILSIDLGQLTINDLNNITFLEFQDINNTNQPNSTWEDLYYRNFYELEWNVKFASNSSISKTPKKFSFNYRGDIKKLNKLPLVLPYIGFYDVSVKLWDFTGNVSMKYDNRKIQVNDTIPEIVAIFKGDDKFDFSVKNLHNIKLSDFGTSTSLHPKVNIVDMDKSDLDIDSFNVDTNVIFSHHTSTEIYNESTSTWDNIQDSQVEGIENLGFGHRKSLSFSDFKDATLDDLFHIRPIDCVMSSDELAGFHLIDVKPNDIIQIGYSNSSDYGYDQYVVPTPPTNFMPIINIVNIEVYDITTLKLTTQIKHNLIGDYFIDLYNTTNFNLKSILATFHPNSKNITCIVNTPIYGLPTEFSGKIKASVYSIEWIVSMLNNNLTVVDNKYEYSNNEVIGYYDYAIYDCFNSDILKNRPIPYKIILASAKNFSKQSFHYINVINGNYAGGVIECDNYSFNIPRYGYDRLINVLKKDNVNGIELISTLIPLSDIISGEALNVDYLLDKYFTVDSDGKQRGNIPMILTDNYFNQDDCKIYKDSFIIPRFKTVLFCINNLHGKNKFEWSLINKNTNTLVVKTRNNPYFIFTMDTIGDYDLELQVFDYFGNMYVNKIANFISVVNKQDYIYATEHKINAM